jgi:hypothetical protein
LQVSCDLASRVIETQAGKRGHETRYGYSYKNRYDSERRHKLDHCKAGSLVETLHGSYHLRKYRAKNMPNLLTVALLQVTCGLTGKFQDFPERFGQENLRQDCVIRSVS